MARHRSGTRSGFPGWVGLAELVAEPLERGSGRLVGPAELRPVALQALSQQATFRVVVLTRIAEIATAATQSLLEGAAATELQDVRARAREPSRARCVPDRAAIHGASRSLTGDTQVHVSWAVARPVVATTTFARRGHQAADQTRTRHRIAWS
jgi:hypothetical protein